MHFIEITYITIENGSKKRYLSIISSINSLFEDQKSHVNPYFLCINNYTYN